MESFARTGMCCVEGCNKPAQTRGWCGAHYQAARRHGDPTVNKKSKPKRKCAVEGCETLTTGELCKAHEKARLREQRASEATAPKVCSVAGCGAAVVARGLCNAHYHRLVKYGSPTARPVLQRERSCEVEGCHRSAYTLGLCLSHYRRHLREQQPNDGGRLHLSTDEVLFIQQNRGLISSTDIADRLGTNVRTVVAIQAGRGWGFRNR